MFITYCQKIMKNKEKIIRRDARKFKKICIKEFNKSIKKGLDTAIVDFFDKVTYDFQEEISEIVLQELRKEYKTINFEFSYRHFMNSYKGIQMTAK